MKIVEVRSAKPASYAVLVGITSAHTLIGMHLESQVQMQWHLNHVGIGSFTVTYAGNQSNLDFRMIPDKSNFEVEPAFSTLTFYLDRGSVRVEPPWTGSTCMECMLRPSMSARTTRAESSASCHQLRVFSW